MIIVKEKDKITVSINHCVNLGLDNPIDNFKQYLIDIEKEFNQELTKTLYQSIRSELII